jgi:hypothetical protein
VSVLLATAVVMRMRISIVRSIVKLTTASAGTSNVAEPYPKL